jgi:histidinol-phosphate aminotransferase
MKTAVTDWIRPEILALSAYHVANADNLIKLDAMENPYRWDENHVEAWLQHLRDAAINRYPDPNANKVKTHLRAVMSIPEEFPLLLGNGSDELIQLLMLSIHAPNRAILAVEPSFVMYRLLAQLLGLNYIGVPLQSPDFSLDLPAILSAIEEHQPALIFLAYPNNPTGNLFDAQAIHQILAISPGIVVVDEAYAPFTEATFLSQLKIYPNLLVMRTLSKLGLAGLRLGLLTGATEWLHQLEKLRLPYNINILTQLSVSYALENYPVLQQQTQCIREDRARLIADLRQIHGVLHVWDSEANFVLFKVAHARAVFEQLRAAGILIKCLDGSHPQLMDCLRVTVGTAEEIRIFLQALARIIA